MARRSLRVSWVLVLAAVSIGCAAGSTDSEVPAGGDSEVTDGVAGDTGGTVDSTTDTGTDTSAADSGGEGSIDGAADGGDAVTDASCDPEAGLTISCGVGECTVTVDACSETGTLTTCKPKDPTPEVCDGKDNNCDGKIDEDLGETSCGMGACQRTQKNCVDGSPKTCTPGTPSTEICNGIDDDCNGAIDDLGTTSCGVGECAVTVNKCEGGLPKTCTPKAPGIEVCNGKDDNCDGKIDEGLADLSCGLGECARVVPACITGVPQTCVPGTPTIEVCDGKDNNCDGLVDNGLADLTCGLGACANTVPACKAGADNTCVPKPKGTEVCNGIDDDCDGVPDDNLAVTVLTCGTGECFNSVAACVAGSPQTCTPKPKGTESCNGKDDDCDGITDNGPITSMCPAPAHTDTTKCDTGSCKTNVCTTGYVDVNGLFSDGCECADSTTPHSCAGGQALGTIAVGGFKQFTGNNPVVGRDDYLTITFLDTKTNKLAHPYITLSTNPNDSFRIEIIPGACSGTAPTGVVPSCGLGGEGNATAKTTWETSYTGGLAGDSTQPNWTPILPGSYTPATDVNSVIYIKVSYRAGAAATCLPYTLTFNN